MKAKKIFLNINELPLIFEVIINGIKKEYVLKFGRNRKGLYITKKEDY